MSIEAVKASFDILDLAAKACGGLVKTGANCYRAKENPLRVEKTSSLCFYADTQSFFDFGSGMGGDTIDFLAKLENLDAKEVVKKYSSNTPQSVRVPSVAHKANNTNATPTTPPKELITTAALELEFNRFETLTFANAAHRLELLAMFPFWLYNTANKADLALFKDLCKYDAINKTTAAKWCQSLPLEAIDDYEIVSYKRRRFLNGKWVNRKDTHPNATPFIRIFDDTAPIIVIEGAHDMLAAVLLGLNFIALPSSGFKNVAPINDQIKPNVSVICFVEDYAAFKAMDLLSKSIVAKDVTLKTFVTTDTQKIDLSDYLLTKNSIEEVKSGVCGLNKQWRND